MLHDLANDGLYPEETLVEHFCRGLEKGYHELSAVIPRYQV
jgi:hypothetical protein